MSDIQTAIHRVQEELYALEISMEGLRTSSDLRALRVHWKAIISSYASAAATMISASKAGRGKSWSDAMKHEQRCDEVLSYLLHARNHDQHVDRLPSTPRKGYANVGTFIENFNTDGTVHFFGGITTTFNSDGTFEQLPLEGSMSYARGTPVVSLDGRNDIHIVRHYLTVETVEDRGVEYPPPSFGVSDEVRAIAYAEKASAWLKGKLIEFRTLSHV